MLDAQPGICIRCDARGAAGTACENRSCKKTRTHLLPEEYATRADDPVYLSDPMVGRVVDDWLVVDVLGRGGFGQVYLVLQLPIFLKAALKLLHRDPIQPDESPAQALARRTAQSKFTGEAQALATLTHPGVVRLLKYGVFENAPYLVMEFAPGRVLADLMHADPNTAEIYRPDHAHHVLRQLTNALEAAHLQKIVHRDVKPANIILQALPGDPFFVRVLDFGIAKFLSEGSRTSVSAGTPIYMAPEQFDRQKIGPWSDLYAVGVMTYELVFGHPPFNADTVERVLAKKLAPDADPLRDIRGRVPPPIETFFARALARRPEDRYGSATELRYGLEALFDAVKGVERKSLLALGQITRASFADADLDDGPKSLASTDMDASVAPHVPIVTRPTDPPRKRWPLFAGLAAVAAGAAVAIGVGASPTPKPADPPPPTTVAQTTPPTRPAAPDVTSPADDVEPTTEVVQIEEVAVVAQPDIVEPDVIEPETVEAAADIVADTTPLEDTRRAATTRARDTSVSASLPDVAPPVTVTPPTTVAPTTNAPDTRETRPYSFVD